VQLPVQHSSYLLDTSAFISLPTSVLDALQGQGHVLYVSPYAFWERLCHLNQAEFERNKGRLVSKRKFLTFLDDPRAQIETPLLTLDRVFEPRPPDYELIDAALAALEASDSLASFYAADIRDSNNRVHRIAGSVERVQAELAQRENRHLAFVDQVMHLFTREQVLAMNDQDRHWHILGLVEGWVTLLAKDTEENRRDEIRATLIPSTYIYFSYIFHRALQFIRDGNATPPSYCFITDEVATRDALNETASLLAAVGDPQFRTTLTVRDSNFLKL
jgi:hypothetical protein